MDDQKLQQRIGKVLDLYRFHNISQLEKYVDTLSEEKKDLREFLKFVGDVYKYSME